MTPADMQRDAAPDSGPQSPRTIRLSEYQVPDYLIDQVDLTFDLHPTATIVTSRLTVRRNPAGQGGPLRLDGERLELLSVALDGAALGSNRYTRTDEALEIADVPDEFTLDVAVRISPADNTELTGLYLSGGNFFTQCEAEGFRRITYFPDRPDVMARYTTTLRADPAACPVLLSNGNPDGAGEADGKRWARWVDPHPKPSYLFAVVAGDLVSVQDEFTTRSGRHVDLGIYVRRGDEDRCDHAMRSLKKSMTWDEDVFGLEYDLDVFNIAAVSDFNMGAMENKGLNVFNTKYVLARPETATDGDYQGIESVIAHEYFHNWTGNRITCRDWFQLSLKEGLTVFRDQEFTADQGSRATKRISDVRGLRAGQFPEDAGPLAHPVRPESYIEINNFYTATVYQKGAELVRMYQTILGREAFLRGMALYVERHDNQAVTIEEFAAAMQDASGVDLTQFKRWYSTPGTPELSFEDAYDADTGRYTLTLRQAVPKSSASPPLAIPVAMGLLASTGKAVTTALAGEAEPMAGTRVLMLEQPEQSFVFDGVKAMPVPSLLRGFSAPVKLSGYTQERLRFLARHDTDPFVRWESGFQYATAALLDQVAAFARGETPPLDTGLIEAAEATLAAAEADPAFAAQALALPSEAYLGDQMAVVDVDGIHAARMAARVAIGRALAPVLRAMYDRLHALGSEGFDFPAMARRALKSGCLQMLVTAGDAEAVRLAELQFAAGGPMSDVLAALSILVETDDPAREAALGAFLAKHRGDDLVIDKWFAIQAGADRPGTLDAVLQLARHPDFDLGNPNRMRALVGSFAANRVHFHDASGAGYRFLADTILALDARNPQIAARMSTPLGSWRRYDPARQGLMRAELERIVSTPDLSRGTFEMVSRSLS